MTTIWLEARRRAVRSRGTSSRSKFGGTMHGAAAGKLVALTVLHNAAARRPAIIVRRTSCRMGKPCSIILNTSDKFSFNFNL
jgi:hypothetical protein